MEHASSSSEAPLIQNFRSLWPDPAPVSIAKEPTLPKRTIPDTILRFRLSATYEHGTAIHFPHLKYNPADFKVSLFVSKLSSPSTAF